MAIKSPQEVSPRARDEVSKLIGRLKGGNAVDWLLQEVFTNEESGQAEKYIDAVQRKRPASDRFMLPNAIDIYAYVRQVAPIVAALDLGGLWTLLTPPKYDSLRREIE